MNKSNPLSTPMVVRSLNVKNDIFRLHEENKEILDLKVPYLSKNEENDVPIKLHST